MIIRRTAAAAAASPSKNRIREYEITIVFMQIRKLLEECSLFSIIKKIFLLDDIIVVKKSVLPIHSIRGVIKVEWGGNYPSEPLIYISMSQAYSQISHFTKCLEKYS